MCILTLPQFAAANPAFSVKQLRWLIYRAESNGLADSGAIVRIGARVYLDGDRFNAWIDTKRVTGPGYRNPMLDNFLKYREERKRARNRLGLVPKHRRQRELDLLRLRPGPGGRAGTPRVRRAGR